MAFRWQDPLDLEGRLSAEEIAIRDAAAHFAQEALAPRIRENFRDGAFDRALVEAFGALGLFGLTLEGDGCPGGSHIMYGLVAREIERIDSAFRSLLSVQSSLVMYPIRRFGSAPVQRLLVRERRGGGWSRTASPLGRVPERPGARAMERDPEINVLGTGLASCSRDPLTGFFRDGACNTCAEDRGSHTVCAVMTAEFLAFSSYVGNDLSTPRPEFRFPGLKPGDRWCLCAGRFLQAYDEGVAPQVDLAATHRRALEIVPVQALRACALPDRDP